MKTLTASVAVCSQSNQIDGLGDNYSSPKYNMVIFVSLSLLSTQ